MHKEIIINVEDQEKRVAVLEAKRLEEFYVERTDVQRILGNIYKGRINSIVSGIGAAFVEIGLKKNGFLYLSDTISTLSDYEEIAEGKPGEVHVDKRVQASPQRESGFKKGQELLVQAVKEPLGTKGVRLTTHISLPGRYLVLMPNDAHTGVSKRIEDEKERKRLKDLLHNLPLPRGMGLIVRTAGAGCTKREFIRDVRYLTGLWRRIKGRADKQSAPALIHEEHNLVLRIIRDSFTEDINRLVVDSKEEYKKIAYFLRSLLPHLKARLVLYQGDEALFDKKGVEKAIEEIYERKVKLPCGGYIVIEQTEGLVAIDVNTGKFASKRGPEETAFFVNQEAAREVARQVRLRDIGGIIIIDFIDMEVAENRRKLFTSLLEHLRRDRAKTRILPLSEMGVVEMTRQRMRKPLESVSYRVCPYCEGRGSVKSITTMSILALRKMKKYLKQADPAHFSKRGENLKKELHLYANPAVATYLLNHDRGLISGLENSFKVKILVVGDANFRIEEIRLKSS